jgi:cation/acetate symporter
MTGNPVPQLGMGGQVLGSDTYLLDKLNGLSTILDFQYTQRYEINGRRLCNYTSFNGWYCRITVIVRFSRLKSERRKEISWYALVLIAIYTQLLIAVLKTNLIETVNGKDYSSMPAWFTKWERLGHLKIKMAMGKFNITTTTQGRSILA